VGKGDLIQDIISGKTGIILEIKQWTQDCEDDPCIDFYIQWQDGEQFWCTSRNVAIISHFPKNKD